MLKNLKFKYFYNALKKRDLAQDFSQSPRKTFASKLNETERIAHLCVQKMNDYFGF